MNPDFPRNLKAYGDALDINRCTSKNNERGLPSIELGLCLLECLSLV